VKCGQCSAPGQVSVTFEIARQRRIKIHFCSVQCAYWGGVLHARTGFATTLAAIRKLFPASLEVLA
jgi:hypothetical protein